MIKKIIALIMRSFVKLYFKLDNECECYCIGTRGDDDDFDIHRRRYEAYICSQECEKVMDKKLIESEKCND